jgi:hypothetical protein
VVDWHVVPEKSRIRFATGPFLSTVRGTLGAPSGVVRLIEGHARYAHVDVRVPVATRYSWFFKWMGLDTGLYPFVSFYGWRVRGNPRHSFALDGELRIGAVIRQVALNVAAIGHRLDGPTDTEEATYCTQFSLDLNSGTGGALRDRRIRVLVDMTLARAVARAAFFPTCRV